MRVFVTGASGWIGSAAVDELLAAGHEVTGLARSDASAATLAAKGVRVRRGDLDDLDSMRAGASDAEAVIHLANKHDCANPAARTRPSEPPCRPSANAGRERAAVPAGVRRRRPERGRPATEDDPSPFHGPDSPRGGAENLAFEFVDRAVRTVSLRFAPTVHGVGDHGFIAAIAGDRPRKGRLRLPRRRDQPLGGRPLRDAARLVALGPGERRRRGAACMPSPRRGSRPERSRRRSATPSGCRHLGRPGRRPGPLRWIGALFGMDLTATSTATQNLFGWTPTGPALIEDLDAGAYATCR